MAVITMKQLLEAGVHFGHQTRRWNPKMAEYIFTERNGIYIIDLQKTVKKVEEAYMFVRNVIMDGGTILFVGTKKQAQEAVRKLNNLEKMAEDGTFDLLPKKEVAALQKEMNDLEKNLGGIKNMKSLPSCMFVVDPKKEKNAVDEARKLGIPVVAIVDTNCDPDEVDYVIPGNDDAIRAIKLLSSVMAEAVIEGKQGEQITDSSENKDAVSAAEAEKVNEA